MASAPWLLDTLLNPSSSGDIWRGSCDWHWQDWVKSLGLPHTVWARRFQGQRSRSTMSTARTQHARLFQRFHNSLYPDGPRPLGCQPVERGGTLVGHVRGTAARAVAPPPCHSSVTFISLAVKARPMSLAMPHHCSRGPQSSASGRYSLQPHGMCNAVCDSVEVWDRLQVVALRRS